MQLIVTKDDIQLKLVTIEHLDFLFDWENNPNNSKHSETKGPFSKAYIRQYILCSQDLEKDGQLRFMIYSKEDIIKPVGLIDLFDYLPLEETASIGILIAAIQHRLHGIGAKSLAILIEYCSEYLPLKKLKCRIKKSNLASIKLFEKCGFKCIVSNEIEAEYELNLEA